MRVLAIHGLGHQEKNPTSWQPLWEKTLQDVLRKWNESLGVEVRFAEYDDLFGDAPMTVGGTLGGFGRLLWDEVRYSVTDRFAGLFGRRRAFGEEAGEAAKWKIGMVTQFAEDEKLRERLRESLLREGDEILTTTHDHYVHHESIRLATGRCGATWRKIPLFDSYDSISPDEIAERIRKAIGPKTRAVGVTWVALQQRRAAAHRPDR